MKITLIPQRCVRTKRPLPLRRVRGDGRHMGFIDDRVGARFMPARHMGPLELKAILDGINDAGGKCGGIGMVPPSKEQLAELQQQIDGDDEDE